jgi:hypothetical protein
MNQFERELLIAIGKAVWWSLQGCELEGDAEIKSKIRDQLNLAISQLQSLIR